ncbi:hypothetical protein E4631_06185 [Hymenobacter sp. UV11]|uniref:DUF6624 domain-containing protein n=1 Tax=Hymenobacter sp. UV11 TaxID=1849735 RepID=UPI00105ED093|nr:DUF6624 domain-containing protein [Hymenobacter sp. UV11]TDN38257.1 hypothetical protein A8B98_24950 [Hymenobacter sp. UV11]TFZ67566.1 hypothetical protein E4631_06185 [Hymenobacter sp. UV11]
MKIYFLSLFLFVTLGASAQQTLNLRLKYELDSLYHVDQLYREAMLVPEKHYLVDSLAAVHHFPAGQEQAQLIGLMLRTDSADIKRVGAIIQRHGYPGKALVGTPTNEAAFYVIQHSNRISQYLPLIKQAADRGELPFRLYAMMLDRELLQHNQAQVYGTQGFNFGGTNSKTGTPEQHNIIWPIQDPAHVNERRKQAGFSQTVEQNAQRMGIPYQVLTMEQVKAMSGYHAF